MTTSLIDTLNGFRTNPALVVELYKQLFESKFYALVRRGTEKTMDKMEFLTYDSQDNIRNFLFLPAKKLLLKIFPKMH